MADGVPLRAESHASASHVKDLGRRHIKNLVFTESVSFSGSCQQNIGLSLGHQPLMQVPAGVPRDKGDAPSLVERVK